MPLHDYQHCGLTLRDQYRSVTEGAQSRPPVCACGEPMQWIPRVGRMDALEPFQRFSAYDGRNQPVVIDSLHKLRQVERESEVLARNGEGQKMTWRMYSQDRSNFDVNTHGPDPSEAPDPSYRKKIGLKKSGAAIEEGYGPSVSDANTSALGMGE